MQDLLNQTDFEVLVDDTGAQMPDSLAATMGHAIMDSLSSTDEQSVQAKIDCVLLLRDGRLPGESPDEELRKLDPAGQVGLLAERMRVDTRTVRRWQAAFDESGPPGLVDRRQRPTPAVRADPRWLEAVRRVLDDDTGRSRTTVENLIERVRETAEELVQEGDEPLPDVVNRTIRRYIEKESAGRGRNLSTKSQRSIANRPAGAWQRRQATRMGELVLIDATPFDAFAMDPITGKWASVHLLTAVDLHTRSILAWRFTAGDPSAADTALLLRDIIQPRRAPAGMPREGRWRYAGVPSTLVVGVAESDPLFPTSADGADPVLLGVPTVVPDTLVLDHGKVFISSAFTQACETMGISVQMSRPYTPTDKSHVERVFNTIRKGFVERLPGYKGPDVYSRGESEMVEDEAFLFIDEIDDRFTHWVAVEYQNLPHKGLTLPTKPGINLTPNQAADISIATSGYMPVPVSHDLVIELLPTEWRTVQPGGIEVNGLIYDMPENSVLDEYRNRKSPYTSRKGEWRVKVDRLDLSKIWWFAFDNPERPEPGRGHWVPIPAKGWPEQIPFTERTLTHVKRVVIGRGYARADRGEVLRELRSLNRRFATDDLTRQEKKLAAREFFAGRSVGALGGSRAASGSTNWDDPDRLESVETASRRAGTTRWSPEEVAVEVFDGEIEPFELEDSEEYDPLTEDSDHEPDS